jgi:hypothetical protein
MNKNDIDSDDIIKRATDALLDVMEHSDNEKLRIEAASKLLSTFAKNKRFEEGINAPKQFTLDVALAVRKEIYGLEN